jgi:hypothetical protein
VEIPTLTADEAVGCHRRTFSQAELAAELLLGSLRPPVIGAAS